MAKKRNTYNIVEMPTFHNLMDMLGIYSEDTFSRKYDHIAYDKENKPVFVKTDDAGNIIRIAKPLD